MAGTWQPLSTPPPFQACTMLLLTDGSVFCNGYLSVECWKLSPDDNGSYVNGQWVRLADMSTTRLYYASAVLSDGRVFVSGGEHGSSGRDTTNSEIYDPVLNSWTPISPPAGWTAVGDAPCCVLNDGRVLLGSINDTRTAIFDPATDTFTPGPNKADASSEETWTLLPDGSVLSVECTNHPQAEKYVPTLNQWVSAGSLPVDLVQDYSIEIGPALLLPDGRVFCTGATGANALYTPPANPGDPGSWAVAASFPADSTGQPREAKDVPAVLLPNGRVLIAVGPGVDGFNPGATFYEYDPLANTLTQVPTPPNAGGYPYNLRLLLVANGQVLLSASSNDLQVYTPDGDPEEDWRPEIVSCPRHLRVKQTHQLTGRQLNGRSQASAYGDDATVATNYPLVRIRSEVDGRERYCRTFDHTSMGVATGHALVQTSFKVPFGTPAGRADLVVIANGIASEPTDVVIEPWRLNFPVTEGAVNQLIGSLADGPLWVLGPNGPVPVDPGWGDIAAEARVAWQQAVDAARTLMSLGDRATRLQVASRVVTVEYLVKEPTRAH